jgi:hypothetical protein
MVRKHDADTPAPAVDTSLVRLSVRPDTIYVSSGRTVLATKLDGFLDGGADQGLFVHETRLVSRYRWSIEGRVLQRHAAVLARLLHHPGAAEIAAG